MRIVTAAEMRAIDARAMDEFGIPGNVLLEHAGLHVAKCVWQLVQSASRRRIVIFAGKGNNGGDGFVAARHLHNWGATVRVFAVADMRRIQSDAAAAAQMARRAGIDIVTLDQSNERNARLNATAADVVVDALLGTGSRGRPKEVAARAIEIMNAVDKPVVSVDVPSGVDADTGTVVHEAVRATMTITFGAPKLGLLLREGRELSGRVVVADIGLPPTLLDDGQHTLVNADVARAKLPHRPAAGHKGTFGRVLVVAGSRGMAGAATLCVKGAQRVGAGLVTLAAPAPLNDVFAGTVPEALTQPLPHDTAGGLGADAADALELSMRKADVIVIGPGLTTGAGAQAVVERVLQKARVPVVIDADALNIVAARLDLLKRTRAAARRAPFVLTPHAAEMARLCSIDVSDVLERPVALARQKAEQWQAVVALKGAPTVSADADGNVFVNGTGSNVLASGGTGDVLAGAVAGLIGQGAVPADAVVAAVFAHGLAGELAARDQGDVGVVAGDVAEKLPAALVCVRNGNAVEMKTILTRAVRIFE